jgi:hypothetical protein
MRAAPPSRVSGAALKTQSCSAIGIAPALGESNGTLIACDNSDSAPRCIKICQIFFTKTVLYDPDCSFDVGFERNTNRGVSYRIRKPRKRGKRKPKISAGNQYAHQIPYSGNNSCEPDIVGIRVPAGDFFQNVFYIRVCCQNGLSANPLLLPVKTRVPRRHSQVVPSPVILHVWIFPTLVKFIPGTVNMGLQRGLMNLVVESLVTDVARKADAVTMLAA